MSEGVVKFISAIICDDVRKEVTGKDLLIGVYSHNITAPSVPFEMNLVFYVITDVSIAGSFDVKFRLSGPGGLRLFETPNLQVVVVDSGIGNMVFGVAVQFQIPGDYIMQGTADNGATWTDIRIFPVRVGMIDPESLPVG